MIVVVLDGGPFDGSIYELDAVPAGWVTIRKRCDVHPEHNRTGRYRATGATDDAGRLVMRYEAP